ncbi:hypothetical protein FZEAL_5593 [Fusarium zealandicum]|uniref:Uncharacterized protein n=1 Tax=Fusarium zealandicum TaxID=1053134 RepID=A0A8H4UKG3_9HYPO|nr:hypothetical protein FZEAL_5593 [Fusarium zealandicum]
MSGQTKPPGALQSRLQDGPSAEEVTAMLETPWDRVYTVSQDGTTYISPRSLLGTPVAKLTEASRYWRGTWNSLDAFLAQEADEERLKKETKDRLKLNPRDKATAAAAKLHQDNVSKHRRIRDIFGADTSYHPNQLVSKQHIPDEGLCHKELMYRLACKISDLRVLRDRHELAMDPWDFIRWRISIKIKSLITFPGQSVQDYIRTIIYKLCEDAVSGHVSQQKYEDPPLRAAILRSARYQNRIGSFNTKANNKPKAAGSSGPISRPRVSSGHRPRPASIATPASRPLPATRPERASRPTEYQGVNAYRAQQKQKAGKLAKKSDE